MLEFIIKDITPKNYCLNQKNIYEYLNQLRNVKLKKDNIYWSSHQLMLNNLRYDYKQRKKNYSIQLKVPNKYSYYNIDNNINTIISPYPSLNDKKILLTKFKSAIKLYRINNKQLRPNNIRPILFKYGEKYNVTNLIQENLRYGLVRHETGFYLKLYKKQALNKWFLNKKPLSSKNHIGIEIECYMKISYDNFAQILQDKVPDLINHVTIKDDGSLSPQGDQVSYEICIVNTENKIHDNLKTMLNLMKDFSLEIDIKCGVHVHLDMRNRDKVPSLNNLYKFQNLLYRLTDKSRKSNKFCKPIKFIEATSYIVSERNNIYSTRYKGINILSLSDHNTYEIRIHAGCIDSERLSSWINLLVKIIDVKNIPDKISLATKKVTQLLNLDNNLSQYISKYGKIVRKKKEIAA